MPTVERPNFPSEISYREKLMREALGSYNILLTSGHFVLTSGKHSDTYFDKNAIWPHPEAVDKLGASWAQTYREKEIDVVVGPATGGILLSSATAAKLNEFTQRDDVLGIFTEEGELTRGFDSLVKNKRVLMVEDVITTGGSIGASIEAVKKAGGIIVGLGVITNRGNVAPEELGVDEIDELIKIKASSWDEKDCSPCAQGIPINIGVGHGKEYLAKKKIS